MKNIKKAIGYVRVSTNKQDVSPDAQREKIKAYCMLHGLELISVDSYVDGIPADEGISGKKASNRPGLQKAMEIACNEKAVVVVYSLSRFARSTKDAIELVARLEKCDADLASISEHIDTTSGMGRFVFRLMASLGELERDQISERTTVAMVHLKSVGRRTGKVPFGFDAIDSGQRRTDGSVIETLVSNKAEQAVIERILTLRGSGESYHTIAATINLEGIKSKSNGIWHASTIREIVLSQKKAAA